MTTPAVSKKPPNILFILSDDQGTWSLGCAGNEEISTPNLDRLAEEGTRFDNFFCASPVCSPARATLLTGKIPSQHGVHDHIAAGNCGSKDEAQSHGRIIEYLQGQTGYTELLADAGYSCGLVGKWHLGASSRPQKSFDLWNVHAAGGGPYYNAPLVENGRIYHEPRYLTDAITDNAVHWLEGRKQQDRPFYLGVHYTAPHAPWSRENHPRELYDHYFNNCPFESVPDGLHPPHWVKHLTKPVSTGEARRACLSGYFAAVTAMDRNIGTLIAWLKKHDLYQNTLVIFTSDNGMNMGHHGVYGKGNATFPMNMFDESVKVPFIVSHPGAIPQGRVRGELLSQYDFMPTLLDYLDLPQPVDANLPGTSFADLLRGGPGRAGERVVVFDEYGPVRMIRTTQWKYIQRTLYTPDELYDLRNDPGETENILEIHKDHAMAAVLRDELDAWFDKFVETERDGSRMKVTGYGQLDICDGSIDGSDVFSTGRGVTLV